MLKTKEVKINGVSISIKELKKEFANAFNDYDDGYDYDDCIEHEYEERIEFINYKNLIKLDRETVKFIENMPQDELKDLFKPSVRGNARRKAKEDRKHKIHIWMYEHGYFSEEIPF